jgi:hypothetical protein
MSESVTKKFVGIDVSKASLDVHIATDKKSLQVAYDEAGIARIVSVLRKAAPKNVRKGLEQNLAWLDKLIAEIDDELQQRLRATCCAPFRASAR